MSFDDPRLQLLSFSLQCQVTRTIRWGSFPGSVVRGALGAILKQNSCIRASGICVGCPLLQHCPYGILFESPNLAVDKLPGEHDLCLPNYHLPRTSPFHICLSPWYPPELYAGESLTTRFTFVGNSMRTVTPVLLAIAQALSEGIGSKRQTGERGKMEVLALQDEVSGKLVPFAKMRFDEPLPFAPVSWQSVTAAHRTPTLLQIHSPLRIQAEGKIVAKPTLGDIIHTAIRRAASLAYFECGVSLALPDRSEFTGHSEQYRLQRHFAGRYSAKQKTRIQMDGVIGSILLPELPNEVTHWLRLGTFIGIGKGVSMGWGDYRML